MAESEQIKLINLEPALNHPDPRITLSPYYSTLLRQPLLESIRCILKPTTSFVDSVLLGKKGSENGVELETTNISELNPTLAEMDALVGGGCFSIRALLEEEKNVGILLQDSMAIFSTISDLKTLLRDDYFFSPTLLMHIIANDAVQQYDKINLHEAATGRLVEFQQFLSWDAKAINLMGCFVFKFLEFLGFLLLEPSQRITELASSMEALKENPVSLVGSVLEQILDKLNNLIRLTLQVTEYISELNLLPETEYNKSDLLSSKCDGLLHSNHCAHGQWRGGI
ncbi:hypothetical protein L6164_013074 [Bauhinia variegata]|uniref:Uncharacterized protein n=1 Tax=Bauhinia variegata TaxID=167791 RepID=A0ACB9PBY8_BAUVA|nr:hypothetical protein L6164_013074 [Bauhinia variegata]